MMPNHIARSAGNTVQERINYLAIGQKMQDLPEELWHKSFRFYVKEDPTRQGGPNQGLPEAQYSDERKKSLNHKPYERNRIIAHKAQGLKD